MKTLVIQTKGGVGKSTVSMQCIAPYMLSRFGKATLIELDDENHDSEAFTKSKIETQQHLVGQEGLAGHSVEKLFLDIADENVVIDVGGNRTAKMTLEHIGEMGFDAMIDMIVIPVSSNGQDIINAEKTLNLIKEKMPDYEGKFVLAMTRMPTTDKETLESIYFEAFELADNYDLEGPVILPDNQVFANCRVLKMSVFEIIQDYDNLSKQGRDFIRLANKEGDRKKIRAASRTKQLVESANKVSASLNNSFELLDSILKTKQETAAKITKAEKEA